MGRVLERYAGSGLRLVGNHLGMDQNDSEADEKDHAQRRAAERMAPKQEMRQQSAQQKNKKCDDQWVAHGGSRCLQKPDHLAASPVMLCAALILNPDRWGRQPAHRQALDRTRVHAPVGSRTAISPDGPWEAAGVRAGGDRPREWPLHGPAPGARCGRSAGRSGSARRSILARVRPFESWKAVEDKLNADYERLKQENPKRAGNLENERKRALTDLRGLKDRLLHQIDPGADAMGGSCGYSARCASSTSSASGRRCRSR